jgi:cell division protein FtsW (lipid II flippase)
MQDGRNETDKERLDRNLNELLGELRQVMPGVQVLFAFLLVVPFNDRFVEITEFQRAVYYVTLVATALATAFLVAPSTIHRLEFRADDKEWIVFTGNRLAIVGFVFLALAITSAILLVTHFVYSDTFAVVMTAVIAALLFVLWFVIGAVRRRRISR